MEQLAEWFLLTPEIRGSNPDSRKFFCLYVDMLISPYMQNKVIKSKRSAVVQVKKNINIFSSERRQVILIRTSWVICEYIG